MRVLDEVRRQNALVGEGVYVVVDVCGRVWLARLAGGQADHPCPVPTHSSTHNIYVGVYVCVGGSGRPAWPVARPPTHTPYLHTVVYMYMCGWVWMVVLAGGQTHHPYLAPTHGPKIYIYSAAVVRPQGVGLPTGGKVEHSTPGTAAAKGGPGGAIDLYHGGTARSRPAAAPGGPGRRRRPAPQQSCTVVQGGGDVRWASRHPAASWSSSLKQAPRASKWSSGGLGLQSCLSLSCSFTCIHTNTHLVSV